MTSLRWCRHPRRHNPRAFLGPWLYLFVAATISSGSTLRAEGSACGAFINPIVCENQKAGDPASAWDTNGAGDATIQGFATEISVNRGETVHFKVDTNASTYRIDVYRLGYYGGLGARKIDSLPNIPGQLQPPCLADTITGLIDCGNWTSSASWPIPPDATSGIYIAKLVRTDTGGASHIVFVVRDDDGRSDLLFQTSDTTWQAYNSYGGNSLYVADVSTFPSLPGRAFKVSYNRPFITRDDAPEDWVFNSEYPMLRWLEANGYDVSYTTGVDTDRRGTELLEHKVFLSVGHDEYWSGAQRGYVEAARNHPTTPVHLAFFSGNEVFWKTRWENSVDGTSTPYRTLVSYKETHANAKIDPVPDVWTGTWRDPRAFNPEGPKPENALTGTIFMVNEGATTAIRVPAADGQLRFWRNAGISSPVRLADETLGYEWDEDLDNGFRPAGLIRMSSTTVTNAPRLQDYGSTYAPGTANHAVTLYRANSGALVFAAGTVQWAWGLDGLHDRGPSSPDTRMRQATVNLLADMSAQPGTLQAGLLAAEASSDTTRPTSVITSPTDGAVLTAGDTVTIRGTADDTGGGVVGGVEVSIDGGTTWHRAAGRESWNLPLTPDSTGTLNIKSRAVDDSGWLETPSQGISVGVQLETTPPTITVVSPSNGTFGVDINALVIAIFSESIDPATINGSTFELRDPSHALVAATTTYDAVSHTVLLDPVLRLATSTSYTATIKGGPSGVKDIVGNPLGVDFIWSFTTSDQPTFVDTTVADFNAGVLSSAVVTNAGNGAVALAASLSEEFSGSTLPAGWSSAANQPGGAGLVGSGKLMLDGARTAMDTTYGPGRSLEFFATFGSAPWQHAGFASDLDFNSPWAIFSTFATTDALYARTGDGANTLIPGNWLNVPHRYRIDWNTTNVVFSIDDVQVASHTVTIATTMRPAASDFEAAGANLSIDWLRMVPPYMPSGSFNSRIFDAGAIAKWGTLGWSSELVAGTSLAMSARTGPTPIPDGTWSGFASVPSSGGAISGTARYMQYRAALSTTDSAVTPILHDVTIGYGNAPPLATNDAFSPNEDTLLTIAAPGLLANDSDPNGKPLTATIVTSPANAVAFSLNSDGSFSYTPRLNFNGTDSFTYKANNGTSDSNVATVNLTVTPVNDAPSFTKGTNLTVLEEALAQTVTGWATGMSPGPPDESGQTLVNFIVSNSNPMLFSVQPAISVNGTLTYTPATNANGVASVTVQLRDNGGTANGGADTGAPQTFTITVTAVNDVPSFTKGANQTVVEDALPQSVTGWATALSSGPPNEAGQVLNFVVSTTNPTLFSTPPAVTANGTLTYTPALNANGVATVSVQVHDNGGTANGGVDTSAAQTFTITVTSVNDAPAPAPDSKSTTQGVPITFAVSDLSANDSAGPPNENGQTLTVTAVNATASTHGSVVLIGGNVTYTPDVTFSGSASFQYTVCDNGTTNGAADPKCSTGTVNVAVASLVGRVIPPPDMIAAKFSLEVVYMI